MTSGDILDFVQEKARVWHYFTNGLRELGLIRVALLDMLRNDSREYV